MDKKNIRILRKFTDNSESKKQIKAALTYLTVKKYVFGDDYATSSELTEVMSRLEIGSIKNMAANIASSNNKSKDILLSPDACKGEGIRGYEITPNGLEEGVKIINSLVNGGDK